jgi:hypothetical protein
MAPASRLSIIPRENESLLQLPRAASRIERQN